MTLSLHTASLQISIGEDGRDLPRYESRSREQRLIRAYLGLSWPPMSSAQEIGIRKSSDDANAYSTTLDVVDAATIAAGLAEFREVYGCLKPFEQKELIHLVLRRAEVSDREIVLEINGNVPTVLAGTPAKSASRFETPNWLPGQDSNLQHGG